MEDNITILGYKDNPYPYIKQSDLLVCLSSSEACPMIFNEAKVLSVPVVSSDFGGVEEFVDLNFGLISCEDNMVLFIKSIICNNGDYKFQMQESVFKDYNKRIIVSLDKLFCL